MSDFASGDLLTFLKSKATITALVGSGNNARIRPGRLMQGDAMPAIRYAITGGFSHQHLRGLSGLASMQLQIDCYGATHSQAWELSEAVRLAMLPFRGLTGDTHISGVLLTNRLHSYEEPVDASDHGKHRFILSFDVAHSEATS